MLFNILQDICCEEIITLLLMQKALWHVHYTILKQPQDDGKQNKLLALQPNCSQCDRSCCIDSMIKKIPTRCIQEVQGHDYWKTRGRGGNN